jgi:hypothetical protein
MEYDPTAGANAVQFWAYNPGGAYINQAALDSEGAKPLPGNAVLAAELGDEPTSRSFGQAGTPDPKVLVATRAPTELAQLRAAD